MNHRKVLYTSGSAATAVALATGGIALTRLSAASRYGTVRAVFFSAGNGTSARLPAGIARLASASAGFAQPVLGRPARPAVTGISIDPATDRR